MIDCMDAPRKITREPFRKSGGCTNVNLQNRAAARKMSAILTAHSRVIQSRPSILDPVGNVSRYHDVNLVLRDSARGRCMMRMLNKALLGVALSASALSAAAPAEAQRYGGGYHGGYHGGGYGYRGGYHGGNGAGLAVGAGILGLAVGAAIASNHNDQYYDRGYRGGYYEGPVYRDTYYYDGPRYRDYRSCWSERVWDGYRGGWARVQRCR
jgi:hypothetical protein